MEAGFNWNPWHGCHKLSAGCANCYVYRSDARYGKKSGMVEKTNGFNLPIQHGRDGAYKIPPGSMVWTCFTSDFFVPDADAWRDEAWRMMKQRSDCTFFFITKRIDRLSACIPVDWQDGYENVHICCTAENQAMADYRLPILLTAPIRHKSIACEPLLTDIDLEKYLHACIERVVVGGESGEAARPCQYDWVLHIRAQCERAGTSFWFKQTGAHFIMDGRRYRIKRSLQHQQARKANINLIGVTKRCNGAAQGADPGVNKLFDI